MRAFLLIAFAAMAATVSCQSLACNSTTAALNVTSVKAAESAIGRGGCVDLDLKDRSSCTFDNATLVYTCNCVTTLNNTNDWESAVRNLTGKACYLDLSITLNGTLKVDSTTTRPVSLTATRTNAVVQAIGSSCTADDIGSVLTDGVAYGISLFSQADVNSDSGISGLTWTSGTATMVAGGDCGNITKTSASTAIPQATTPTPTTPVPTMAGNTTSSPTGNTTSSPTGNTTASPTPTATPTSAGNTTNPPPTTPPKGGDASSIASSLVLVASLIAATVTIVA